MSIMSTVSTDNTLIQYVPVAILLLIIIYQGIISWLDRRRHDLVVKQLTAAVISKSAAEYHELMLDQGIELKKMKLENKVALAAAGLEQEALDAARDLEGHIPIT